MINHTLNFDNHGDPLFKPRGLSYQPAERTDPSHLIFLSHIPQGHSHIERINRREAVGARSSRGRLKMGFLLCPTFFLEIVSSVVTSIDCTEAD